MVEEEYSSAETEAFVMTQSTFRISDFAGGQAHLFCEIHLASVFKLRDVYLTFTNLT